MRARTNHSPLLPRKKIGGSGRGWMMFFTIREAVGIFMVGTRERGSFIAINIY